VQRNVLDPLGRMVAAMRSIQGGELDTRMRTTPSSSEFAIVDSTFNGMMERIRDLKIDVYEEKLNAQKAELKHLQLQIKPHFYLNSLNIIFHMAQMREFELIQEMTLKLVDYFRYMMKSDSSFVSLGEEIEHVRTYQRIQEIRLAGERSLALEAPGEAMTAAVPPLLIQTFVENSGKYGIEEDGSLHISIGISLSENRESIAIRIADRGRGFSEPMLASLNTGTLEPDENGEKIGIFNMRRRLSILYHGRASLGFENGEPGAIVSIGIPFTE
jgi:two-component system sensor histidine kinase YesM